MIAVYIIALMVVAWLTKVAMDTYAKRERYRSEQYMMQHSQRMKQDLIQDNAVTRELSDSLATLAEQTDELRKENIELKERVRYLEKLASEAEPDRPDPPAAVEEQDESGTQGTRPRQ